jgi:hypothetical protein
MNLFKKYLKKLLVIRKITRFYFRAKKKLKLARSNMDSIRPVYSKKCPSNQTMVDIFKGGWASSFPDQYNIFAGQTKHFEFSVDPRVQWLDSDLAKGIKNLTVLELGPYEAYNTWQLEKLGAKSVVSVEGNNLNFLKCLIVKEITGLKARFLYGDLILYLEHCKQQYDIVYASGVLYHSSQPLRLLELITRVTDKVFIYTHYFHQPTIDANPFLADFFCPSKDIFKQYEGEKVQLHYRSYSETKDISFCGGGEDYSYWLEKEVILDIFHRKGFNNIKIHLDQLDNPHCPALCFFAERKLL